jgi:multidrug efflux pump subunit AcrA (membrane-fusion protein)
VVFVRTAPGRFERREVEIGRVGDELAEVLGGVDEGQDVVTEGSFLLRSQASADELGGHHH